MMPKKQLEGWIRSQLFVDMEAGPCKKLVLRHVSSASRMGSVVLNIDVPIDVHKTDDEGGISDPWIEDTIKNIEFTAQGDADGAGGQNNYVIQSFHGELDKPSARFAIKMHGSTDIENDDISSEPPTKTGLIGQLMRHNEAIMRTSTIATANALSTMQRIQSKQEMVIEKLLSEKYENFTIVENLLSQKNEREIAQAKAAQKMEMQEKVVDKLMLMAPLALNKFMGSRKGDNGQKMLPETTTTAELQIASLADTFTDEQLGKLMTVLSPEQSMVIINLFTQAKEKQAALLQKPEESK